MFHHLNSNHEQINDEMLLIGAPRDSELDNSSGAVYKYSLINNDWAETEKIFAPKLWC